MSAQSPLLTYRFATSPSPLQASTPETASQGRINVTVTTGQDDVYCDWIQIAVPKNSPAGGAYFTDTPDFSTDDDEWALASLAQVSGKHLGLKNDDAEYYRAIFRYSGDDTDPISGTVHFGVSGPLSTITGTLDYHITEHSDTSSDPEDYTARRQVVPLPVTAPVLYLHAFLARDGDSATAPKTRFSSDSSPYLSWESNGSNFRLYDGDGTIVYEGPDTFYSVDAGSLTADTTYTLEASFASGSGEGGNDFEPVYQYATLSLTVTDPTLSALTVRGNVEAESTLDVRGSTTVGADLTVRSSLTVQNAASVGWDLTVNGSTYAQRSLSVNGDLNAASSVYARSDLTVSGTLHANGDLNANSTLNAYGQVNAVSDYYVRIRELRGPSGEKLSINSNLEVLSGCSVKTAEDIWIKGYKVFSNNDTVSLWNKHYQGYFYATMFVDDNRRQVAVWEPGNDVNSAQWTLSFDS